MIALLSYFSLFLCFSFAQQCNNSDYVMAKNGQPLFTIVSNNGSCICNSFVAPGANSFGSLKISGAKLVGGQIPLTALEVISGGTITDRQGFLYWHSFGNAFHL